MKTKTSFLLVIAFVCVLAGSVYAQESQPQQPSSPPPETPGMDIQGIKNYLLGPGDVLDVRVFGQPDLSSTEAFVRMLRNAKSIGYSTAGSGLMVANIIKTLGLTEELKARTKFLDGFPAAEGVARGEVEIALQQINVIVPVAGAELAGPLPAELQQYNHFAVGVLAVSKEREAATAMVRFMAAPENAEVLRKGGLEPPAR